VSVVGGVTHPTGLRRIYVLGIRVAPGTRDEGVSSDEGIAGLAVIEGGLTPAGGVASATLLAELAMMCIVRSMAVDAGCRRVFIDAVSVTFEARGCGVGARQREV
jgi:hypothetical protein